MNSIYLKNNRYGYRLNLNHPKINELYRRYKEWKGLPVTMPLTDAERRDFEEYVLSEKNITPP